MTAPRSPNAPNSNTVPDRPQLAIFTRSLAPESYEILALSGLDAVVFDVEHGIFDRSSLSRCVFTAQAGGLSTFVRLSATDTDMLQSAVGLGIDGLIVSHLSDVAEAARMACFVRGACVARAHAGATRASRYRETDWMTFAAGARRLILLAQIDDTAGVAAAAALAGIAELDGAFIGRISLLLEMKDNAHATDAALLAVCQAFQGRLIGISAGSNADAGRWRQHGAQLFVVDNDQRLLLAAARERVAHFQRIFATSQA